MVYVYWNCWNRAQFRKKMLHTILIALSVVIITCITAFLFVSKTYPTIWYDVSYIKKRIVVIFRLLYHFWRKRTFVDLFEAKIKKNPTKPCILYKDVSYTYLEVDQHSNRLANVLKDEGLVKKKDVTCLFMYNEPAYVFSWFSLRKLGAIPALVPFHLRGKALLQCISITKASTIICGKDSNLIDAIADILPDLQRQGITTVLVHGTSDQSFPDGFTNLEPLLKCSSDRAVPRDRDKNLRLADSAMYMFSSGTTGLPKPNRVSHARLFIISNMMYGFGITSADTVYVSQPFHHGLIFIPAVLSALKLGATLALRPTFSAVHFWEDVRRFRANAIQYTNETCRYLLAQPRRKDDGVYPVQLKLAYGYGLRPEIWPEFKNRFKISKIGEIWAEMEGVAVFVNWDGTVGATGLCTPLMKKLTGIEIIAWDYETRQPIRDKNGLYISHSNGSPGLMVIKMKNKAHFDGYVANERLNEKALLENVRLHGDMYMNTGDIMVIDKDFHIFFKDRACDSFRCGGEVVFTTEVERMVDQVTDVQESNTYGILLPGFEEKICMSAVVLKSNPTNVDWCDVFRHLTTNLPGYACPKILRITEKMDLTSTFKHIKYRMASEGADPEEVQDDLYFMDTERKTFSRLNSAVYGNILSKKREL